MTTILSFPLTRDDTAVVFPAGTSVDGNMYPNEYKFTMQRHDGVYYVFYNDKWYVVTIMCDYGKETYTGCIDVDNPVPEPEWTEEDSDVDCSDE